MLMMRNETEGLLLGQSAYGWCRMQSLQQVAQTVIRRQGKRKVAPQMNQIGGTDRDGAFL